MVKVSVPGKVHLMGEHAVVYGAPAFLSAINKRLSVSVKPGVERTVWSGSIPDEVKKYGDHILALVAKEQKLDTLPALSITVQSDIPFGYHLGSSAAFAVALVGAVIYFLKKTWNPVAINTLAFEAEKFVHGNPSGGDNTIVTFGGWVWFRRELPFLKSIWQLPINLPASLNHFCLINTGKPEETTGEMVTSVAKRRRDEAAKFDDLFQENEVQTRRLAVALKEGDEVTLIDAMKKGEQTLEHMGVVSDAATSIIRIIEQNGGAAKILGGGGDRGAVGFLLAYHPDHTALQEIVKQSGYPIEQITLGEEGIRLEQKE